MELELQLRNAERLTIEKYRSAGVEVVETESSEVENWIAKSAQDMKDAAWDFKLLTYCKANGFDVVGGIKMMNSIKGKGATYNGWVLNLRRMTRSMALYGQYSAPVELLDVFDMRAPDRVLSHFPRPPSRRQWCFDSEVPDRRYKVLPCPHLSDRPLLGIFFDEQGDENPRSGVLITYVGQSSPAEECGMRIGDIITAIDGISAIEMLGGRLAREYVPGTEITVDVLRESRSHSCRTRLIAEGEYYQRHARATAKEWVTRWIRLGANSDTEAASEARPRAFVLYFWGFFDGEPSLVHLPVLQLLWERYQQDGLVWVSVNCDPDVDNGRWQEYVRANKLGGIQLSSPTTAGHFAIDQFPTAMLLASDGTVLERICPKDLTRAVVQLMKRVTARPAPSSNP